MGKDKEQGSGKRTEGDIGRIREIIFFFLFYHLSGNNYYVSVER